VNQFASLIKSALSSSPKNKQFRMKKYYDDILETIGNTPMVKIKKLTGKNDSTILAKLEMFNPGGSVKDRAAKYMIEYAEKQGKLTKDKIILEPTSGNTGIGLAMVASVKGYKVLFTMPESVSLERRKILQAFGAKILLTPKKKGTDGAIEKAYEMARKDKGKKYFLPDQFNNKYNSLAHYETTGKEIWEQTDGKVDMLIAAMGTAYKPGIYNRRMLDEKINIKDEDAFKTARELALKEGLLIGMSSGAVMFVALQKAKELGRGKVIVTILPDTGERYLTTKLFNKNS